MLSKASEPTTLDSLSGKKPPVLPTWLRITALLAGTLVLAVFAVMYWFARHATPMLRQRAIQMLEDRFESEVEIQNLQVAFFPVVSITGSGVTIRHHGRTDVPPLITIADFRATESWTSLLTNHWHLSVVQLKGLSIHVPPRENAPMPTHLQTKGIPVSVDELIASDTELQILSNKPDKPPHIFEIHQLTMHSLGLGRSAPFHAILTNPTPPGEIASDAQFGPWNRDEPRTTPVSGGFTFTNADLGVFHGIAGILSSTGKYDGVLESITVEGQTLTPDFRVDVGDHPVSLKTEYSATVDGTNGNTFLHPVIASFLNSRLVANGAVVKALAGNGREVQLEVEARNARIEDLMSLAVKSSTPIMTGSVDLKTLFDLPPGEGNLIERLRLQGEFGLNQGRFTDEGIREKIESLSRRAQGKPNDQDVGSAVSDLSGQFSLKDGIITFRKLTFSVEGASVQLAGTYALRGEELDFHGHLQADARLSRMTTGYKSFLLRPFDGFFRKNGKTDLPIKITGTRNSPSFGLELRKKN